jgi:hypothetical protein
VYVRAERDIYCERIPASSGAGGCQHVRALKITAFVDVETLHITGIHSTTSMNHDAKIGTQVVRRNAGNLRSLAADRGYDTKASTMNSGRTASVS